MRTPGHRLWLRDDLKLFFPSPDSRQAFSEKIVIKIPAQSKRLAIVVTETLSNRRFVKWCHMTPIWQSVVRRLFL